MPWAGRTTRAGAAQHVVEAAAPLPRGQAHALIPRAGGSHMSGFHEVEDENKLATILFADIVDSTALVEEAEGDEALDLLRGALEAMGACIAQAGGTINRVMGDGVMALFGAPRSQEDHALAACLAARAMLAAVAARFPALRLRVGVHSGDFIVHAVHSGNLRALDATGSVAHLAARIQAAATPGEAWISEATRSLAGGAVTAEPLGPVALKGRKDPLPLHRLLAAQALPRSAPAAESPLLGRARELRAIRRLRESGGALLVLGEPGMGKTRLLAEALRGIPALRGAALRLGGGDFHAIQPMLGAAATPPGLEALSPMERRAALVAGAAAALRGWAAATPGGVLLLDDVQWLDDGSAEVVRALLPAPPCPLVLLARAGEAPPWAEALPRLALEPLDARAATELALWRLGASAPEEVVGLIRERCGGNPLFIEQAALSPDPRRLPPDVRVILSQRIDALPAPAKRVLETLAAVGEPCAPALLADAEAGAAPLLEALEAQGFVTQEEGQVACRHALFGEVAYAGLTARRRQALHARIARAAEAQPGGSPVALLARQARLGALWEPALRHARAAAEQALARFANRDAAAFLDGAIEALDQMDAAQRPPGAALELRLLLRDPLFRLGRMDELRTRLLEAEALAQAAGDRAGLAQLRVFRSHQSWLTGDFAAALAAADDAAAQAAQDGDAALALRACFQRGLWAIGTGAMAQCAALMAAVAAGAEDPAHGGRFGLDAPLVVVARGYQARALVELGEVAAARAAADAATAQAARVDRPFSWIFAAFADGVVLRAEGRPAAAAARIREGLAQCDRAETALMRVVGLMLLGAAEADAGDWAAAEAHLAQSAAQGEAMRFLVHQPQRLAMRARALHALGRPSEGAALEAAARAMATAQGDATALRMLG